MRAFLLLFALLGPKARLAFVAICAVFIYAVTR